MERLPSLFLSHGAPTLVLEDGPASQFLAGLGAQLGRPRAILMASAHWETEAPRVQTTEQPGTIYDFFGFPKELYEIVYAAPGAPEIAARAAALLGEAGIPANLDAERGLDHGAWVPLQLMYPQADVPVAQLALQSHLGPEHHLRLGEALRPLREDGVLIVGSGGFTHNLAGFRSHGRDDAPPAWVSDFADWTAAAILEGCEEALLDYRRQAPNGELNHPTEEHFLPLFVALGAGGPEPKAERLHASYGYGVLAMDAFAFS